MRFIIAARRNTYKRLEARVECLDDPVAPAARVNSTETAQTDKLRPYQYTEGSVHKKQIARDWFIVSDHFNADPHMAISMKV